ncbi:response regulator [Pseudoalteromonas ulvae]|uniref:Response regulatory domain-containing protein n=1 Tax=Pseudoalteromonas ulvae TaxID=107327 RepID=A0A244CQJ6_PSEDV|nr:response regulator [Pseudoalteromonas ulvae]OUL57766.1 hypothetical protein B1199_11980 [Pseudoalteromonas ulvae]
MHSALKLNVLLFESQLNVRTHLITLLKKLGCTKVKTAKTVKEVISQLKTGSVDLLLMDFDTDHYSNGNDFIRYLITLKGIPDHCRVLFLSDQPERALSDLAFRYTSTDVLEKPVSQPKLKALLTQYNESSQRLKIMFTQLRHASPDQQLAILSHATFIGLSSAQNNELQLIKAAYFLKLNHVSDALDCVKAITQASQQASAQLAIYSLIGDEKKLKLTLLKMQSLNLLTKKQTLFSVKHFLHYNEFYQSLVTLNQLPEFSLSAHEAELKAVCIYETQGIENALEYLEKKLKTTLVNQHYLGLILMSMIRLIMLEQCLFTKQSRLKTDKTAYQIKVLIKNLFTLNNNEINQSCLPFLRLYLQILENDPSQSTDLSEKHALQLKALCKRISHASEQLICLACAVELKRTDIAVELVRDKIQLHGMMDSSAQSLAFDYFILKLFDSACIDENHKASYFNTWAIERQDKSQRYLALAFFAKAHFLAPTNPVYLLNLLNTMQSLKLSKYWRYQQSQLLLDAQSLTMTQAQQQRLAQLAS